MMYFVGTKLSADPKTDEGKKKYEALINAVTSLGAWSDRLDSAWLVESRLPASRIRTLLKPHLKDGDRVFVAQFSQNWAASNMGNGFPEWMKRREFEVPSQG